MVAQDRFWWFTPLQIATTVVAGMNCGASALQSPLTWPMLQENIDVPVHYVGRQTENLLRGSEFLFPPFNAFCTIGNLAMTAFCYYNPQSPRSEKLQLFAVATGMHIAVTVYTLTIMAPYNTKLKVASKKLNQGMARGEEKTESQRKATQDFRDAQKVWKFRNYGRGLVMLAAVTTSAIALS
ncbi:hypothetical protein FKW77_000531 [Venturia effusa]|uniref:DUF1772-domain-containing protein n=1 Tax=Venturia effusa TaxID=50376 RepID=A0A517L8G6_9PEZI|nr:hypothetical protein FKW77_000531 [Venturia effusa]